MFYFYFEKYKMLEYSVTVLNIVHREKYLLLSLSLSLSLSISGDLLVEAELITYRSTCGRSDQCLFVGVRHGPWVGGFSVVFWFGLMVVLVLRQVWWWSHFCGNYDGGFRVDCGFSVDGVCGKGGVTSWVWWLK